MWESRNSSLPSDITQEQVNHHINALSSINTTHITVAGFMDYPSSVAKWVTAIRSISKKVWFRLTWDHWQGAHGFDADMSPSTYTTDTVSFIENNATLFENGDIFEFALEPAVGSPHWNNTYGNDWSSGDGQDAIDGRAAYNSFVSGGIEAITTIFNTIEKSGVITSMNSEVTNVVKDVYTQNTVDAMSALCIDFHPEGSDENITTNLNLHINEIEAIKTAWPHKNIIYSEISYCNDHEVADELQKNTLTAYFNYISGESQIVGVNYWQSVGSNSAGVRLISGDKGAWNTARESFYTVQSFYAQEIEENGYFLIHLPNADLERYNEFNALGVTSGNPKEIPHARFSHDGTKVIVQGKIIESLLNYASGKTHITYLGRCLANGRAEQLVYDCLSENSADWL